MEEAAKPAQPKQSFFTKLKHPSSFSKPQLAVFVLVFAAIGYLIFRAFATSPLIASLEAEQMTLPAGGSVISDSAASGGKAIKLTSNGTATGSVSFASSVTSMTVVAKADQCQGSPYMTVTLDGTNRLTNLAISATSWTSYTYTPAAAIASGTHNLSITMSNAGGKLHGKNNCSRNLYVDITNFYGPAPAPTPAPTVALSASPTSLTAGQSSTLTWSSTNATSCTASGAWSGSEPTSGSVSTGAINQTSTYSLTCTGAGGSATASTTVTVSTVTSGNCNGGTAYCSAISYSQTRPAFTPKRTVNVSDATGLRNAITNLQPGDLVKASAPFTVSAGGTSNGLVIANRLSAPAVIDLTGISIIYTGTGNQNSVWVRNVQNVWIFGGDLSMSQPTVGGGSCIGWTASQHSMWWGFYAHDCGSGGMGIFTAKPGYSYAAPVEYDDIQGEVGHFSLNGGLYDPHTEKCSGLHGANLADGNYYAFDHNRIALYVHDSACTGGGIEFGSAYSPTTSPAGPIPDSNTIYLKCLNLTFISTIQTGGNCYQTWGYGETNTDLKYIEAVNLTGHPYWAGGMYSKPNNWLSTDVLEYGRATNVRQNSRYANDKNWDTTGGTVFKDVSPLP